MLSTCPNCKRQIEHDDFLFEVLCQCGSRFNPFMVNEGLDPLAGLAEPKEMSASQAGAALGGGGALGSSAAMATPAPDPASFQESNNAFQEIVNFGEGAADGGASSTGLGGALGGAASAPAANPFSTPAPAAAPRPVAAPLAEGTECPVSAADAIPGFRIEATFLPVSAMAPLDGAGGDPMRNAFQLLWQNISASGGNGCVALRWELLPNGSQVVVSGIPVRVSRG